MMNPTHNSSRQFPSGDLLFQLLRDAQRSSGMGAWRLSLPDNTVEWSEEVFELHHWPEGKPIDLEAALGCYPPESRVPLVQALERCRNAGEPFDLTLRFTDLNQVEKWVRVLGRAIEQDGRVVALAGTIEDVSRQHETQSLNRRLLRILDEYPDVVALVDASGAVTWCNRTAKELLADERGGFQNPQSILAPWALKTLQEVALPNAHATGSWVGELALRLPDGAELPMMATIMAQREESGAVDSLAYILKDITVEREQQRRLAASEAKFRNAFRVSPVGMALAAPDGMLLEVNDAFCRMLAYSRAELLRMDFQAITHPDDVGANVDLVNLAHQGEIPSYSLEKRYIAKDGRVVHAVLDVAVLRDEQGRMTGLLGHVQDVTEARREEAAREVLQRQFQLLAQQESFAAVAKVVAREFNNLLVGMLGAAGLAKMDLPPDSPARTSIELVEGTAQRGAELIRQLVAYAGTGRQQSERFDLADLIREMHPLLLAAIGQRASLRLELDPKGIPIRADSAQVRQMVMNLVLNSAEFMGRRGGSIVIRSGARLDAGVPLDGTVLDARSPDRDHLIVTIEDTGTGMDQDTLARIFEPFYSTKPDGQGLGLPAVLGIVRSNEGLLAINSELGRGTAVTFGLPAAGPQDAEPDPGTPVADRSAVGPILVVDDDPTTRNVVGMLLRREGYETLAAADGSEALNLMDREGGRLGGAVLDLILPGLQGDTLLRLLRARRPNIPVIVITAYRDSETAVAAMQFQPDAILPKPFRPEELVGALRMAIRARR